MALEPSLPAILDRSVAGALTHRSITIVMPVSVHILEYCTRRPWLGKVPALLQAVALSDPQGPAVVNLRFCLTMIPYRAFIEPWADLAMCQVLRPDSSELSFQRGT
jgi:hypothetical protein